MPVINADCIEHMNIMPPESVDSIVTDPPYHLTSIVKRFGKEGSSPAQFGTDGAYARASKGFMGKEWDGGDIAFRTEVWEAALRVAKPGAYLLAFGGTRTFHRMAVAIEDAGWEIRDTVMWVYGSGFPKSHNVGKGIDKAAGAERDVVGVGRAGKNALGQDSGWNKTYDPDKFDITVPATPDAEQWDGWGTALKPAWEPIIVARKPLDGTVASNVLEHGTGAMNIDGCRVETSVAEYEALDDNRKANRTIRAGAVASGFGMKPEGLASTKQSPLGRWPANLIHDGSDEVVRLFPDTGKSTGGRIGKKSMGNVTNVPAGQYEKGDPGFGDSGSAARFFYCAKANKNDRNEGCDEIDERKCDTGRKEGNPGGDNPRNRGVHERHNHHPTVKPTALMRYLCKLVTRLGGTVLDPFCGSGSTGKAAILEGFKFIGIEKDAEYFSIAEARINFASSNSETALEIGHSQNELESPSDQLSLFR